MVWMTRFHFGFRLPILGCGTKTFVWYLSDASAYGHREPLPVLVQAFHKPLLCNMGKTGRVLEAVGAKSLGVQYWSVAALYAMFPNSFITLVCCMAWR